MKRIKTIGSLVLLSTSLPLFALDRTSVSTATESTVQAQTQNGTLTGLVKDTQGEPITGASILVKGTGHSPSVGSRLVQRSSSRVWDISPRPLSGQVIPFR